ncbi:hypothetical protein B5V89_11585 [Heyndrickxia sporothermodurans]|uniref:hypothetical protein n=1 Tax=Heyndrickxia TaxID=2837504 RepID=UPI000D38B378|nr:hypothetical protein [Heyndrickxia sporothermodurans]PTY78112.1 hypothetical protein B5V89_11585 [Heyndrickxia sporothermodurans]
MKKVLASMFLLIASIVYLIWRITKNTIFLSDVSLEAKNPVSFHWLYLQIDTNLIQHSEKSLYTISLVPMYLMIIIAIVLVAIFIKKRR